MAKPNHWKMAITWALISNCFEFFPATKKNLPNPSPSATIFRGHESPDYYCCHLRWHDIICCEVASFFGFLVNLISSLLRQGKASGEVDMPLQTRVGWVACGWGHVSEGMWGPPRGQGRPQGTGGILSGCLFKPRRAPESAKTFDFLNPKNFSYMVKMKPKAIV